MRAFLYCVVTALTATSLSAQPSITDTRLLSQPALSATHVAFIYAGDLWTSKLDGTDVRRLTTADGDEQSPVFSPNGEMIAFSANYDGNTDVYIIPSAGGTPKRLTYHPDADIVQGFTPDGKAVLFTSGRSSHTNRYTQLFTVPITGGPDTKLPIPNAARAAYSPDGKHIARSTSGSTTAAGARPPSGSTMSPRTASRRSRSPRDAPTTWTPSGSATPSTSAPTATASSTSTRTTARRRRCDA